MSASLITAEEEKEMKPLQLCELIIGELPALGVSRLDLEYGDVKVSGH